MPLIRRAGTATMRRILDLRILGGDKSGRDGIVRDREHLLVVSDIKDVKTRNHHWLDTRERQKRLQEHWLGSHQRTSLREVRTETEFEGRRSLSTRATGSRTAALPMMGRGRSRRMGRAFNQITSITTASTINIYRYIYFQAGGFFPRERKGNILHPVQRPS